MAGIKLSEFKSNVKDVARPNRFLVSFAGNGAAISGGWSETKTYLVKSSQLPSREIGMLELNWQGMKTKLAGDPTFSDISFTVLNDVDFEARNFFETWTENIANMSSNERTEHADYKGEVYLTQLGKTGEKIAEYVLLGAFPVTVDAIDLSMDSVDTAEEFNVTMTYDYFKRNDASGISLIG